MVETSPANVEAAGVNGATEGGTAEGVNESETVELEEDGEDGEAAEEVEGVEGHKVADSAGEPALETSHGPSDVVEAEGAAGDEVDDDVAVEADAPSQAAQSPAGGVRGVLNSGMFGGESFR